MCKQCLDAQQMQHLQGLGLDTSNASCYIWEAEGKEYLYFGKCTDINGIPTFTLQDILDLLPKQIIDKCDDKFVLKVEYCILSGVWCIGYCYYDVYFNDKCWFSEKNLIDAAYEMMCWCVENGYIETKKK